MLRIKEEGQTEGVTTLRLDGSLVNEWTELLRSSCESALRGGGLLILDLSGVCYADFEGVKLLRRLEAGQTTLMNCSPFLREQMKQSANPVAADGSGRN